VQEQLKIMLKYIDMNVWFGTWCNISMRVK